MTTEVKKVYFDNLTIEETIELMNSKSEVRFKHTDTACFFTNKGNDFKMYDVGESGNSKLPINGETAEEQVELIESHYGDGDLRLWETLSDIQTATNKDVTINSFKLVDLFIIRNKAKA